MLSLPKIGKRKHALLWNRHAVCRHCRTLRLTFSRRFRVRQIKSSLYSPYYAEACNELRGQSPRLSAWATQLRRNVVTVISRWRHFVDLTGPGIESQTSRTDGVRLATELKAGLDIRQSSSNLTHLVPRYFCPFLPRKQKRDYDSLSRHCRHCLTCTPLLFQHKQHFVVFGSFVDNIGADVFCTQISFQ